MQLLDLLLPPTCGLCSRPGRWLCAGCAERLPWCENTWWNQEGLTIGSALSYSAEVGSWLHAWKYERCYAYTPILARLLWLAIAPQVRRWGAVIWVPTPLAWQRWWWRGGNQAAWLARELAKISGSPVAPLLRRTSWHGTQAQRGRVARLANQEVYQVHRDASCLRNIVLVDDVCTTGSTIKSMASALKVQGCQVIGAVTIARVE